MPEDDVPTWNPDATDWDEVRAARRTNPIDKTLAALRLQEMAREFALEGIRRQHPSAPIDEVVEMFDRRMAAGRPWGPRRERD